MKFNLTDAIAPSSSSIGSPIRLQWEGQRCTTVQELLMTHHTYTSGLHLVKGGAKINIKDSGEVTLRVLPRGGGYIVNIYCGEGSQWIS